jgi:hypothetical protein
MANGYMGAMAQQAAPRVGMANPRQQAAQQAVARPTRQRGARGGVISPRKQQLFKDRGRGVERAPRAQRRQARQQQHAAQKLARQEERGARREGRGRQFMGRQRFGQRAAQRFGTAPGRPAPDGFGGRVTAIPQQAQAQQQARQVPPRMARQQARGMGARARFR